MVVERFSKLAVWTVPPIYAAGLLLAWRLLPGTESLLTSYGLLPIGKISGFSLLMLPAALNKSRLGLRINSHLDARDAFRRGVAAELLLVSTALTMTSVTIAFSFPGG